jgi:hypothetical protein
MCMVNTGGLPKPQQAAPAPTREAATVNTDPVSLVEQSKKTLQKRMGIFGNLTNGTLGDASYGTAARFGAAA